MTNVSLVLLDSRCTGNSDPHWASHAWAASWIHSLNLGKKVLRCTLCGALADFSLGTYPPARCVDVDIATMWKPV